MKRLLFFFFSFVLLFSQVQVQAQVIKSVKIDGNYRIETSTILNYLNLDVGQNLTETKKDQAIKALFASGFFEDVQLNCDNGVVLVLVKENPLIHKIIFSGNSKIKSDALGNEVYSKAGQALNKTKIAADVERMVELYKASGRFNVKITPHIKARTSNVVDITFKIIEGPKTLVRHVYFVGNDCYSSRELQAVIVTKESRWYRFFANDTYSPYKVEYDKELLTAFYKSVGFADAQVLSATAELSQAKDSFSITYTISEGIKYSFGKVGLTDNIPDLKEDFSKYLKFIKTGDVFNINHVNAVIEAINARLSDIGYAQANITPQIQTDPNTRIANVHFSIDLGAKYYVNRINIIGNVKTKDSVIRSRFKLSEGDIFNSSMFAGGVSNLKALDYFELNPTVTQAEQGLDKYNINLEVQEKSTAQIGAGAGYNTTSGIFGNVYFKERNFCGTGKNLNLMAQIAKNSKLSFVGSITEPRFFDKDLEYTSALYIGVQKGGKKAVNVSESYNQKTFSFDNSLQYDITDRLSHSVNYLIKDDNLKAPSSTSSPLLREQMGNFVTSAIGQKLRYFAMDSNIAARRGYNVVFSESFAGLGGNNKYFKNELEFRVIQYFKNNSIFLKVGASVGNIMAVDNMLRINDRLNLGGISLRGFAYGGVGPMDTKTKTHLGGQNYYAGSAELQFPIGAPKEFNVKGVVFCDVGNVWGISKAIQNKYGYEISEGNYFRTSVGVGINWQTSLMPIQIYFSWPVRYLKKEDVVERFFINMATDF
ncbi:Outer membrane protein assembly factor BamA [Rickettsiales endosymbiont of Paramecium tredecaurelia]|uniref:outer membrane protein assembly factor BamA n=1 Tax=Candidatus Sarmatiella mevalonica TaxID=2770581 RepID=UPI001921AD94|nr:outer membrane protein assembly factor BamA [Candidatus Sarmatiella mevalonica]MBL3284214.1 Outer membrane protein assembly factor BamA [Candidatus Sarmatiella mevalonica]